MANFCSFVRPPNWGNDPTACSPAQPVGTSVASLWNSSSAIVCNGKANPIHFYNNYRNALSTPWYFDADLYAIECAAFPSSSGGTDPVISQAAAINILNTSVASLQTQMAAFSAGSITQAPNPEIIEASALIFGAFLVAGAAVWGLKRIYRLLATDGGIDG